MEGMIRNGVCFFCHDGKGNYLISRRSKGARDEHGRWDPGAGGIKFGETSQEAIVREVREEYKTVPLEVEFLGHREVFREEGGVKNHWIAFDFRVLVDPEKVGIGEPHKCDALKWVTIPELEQFSEPLHSQFPTFIKKYHAALV